MIINIKQHANVAGTRHFSPFQKSVQWAFSTRALKHEMTGG